MPKNHFMKTVHFFLSVLIFLSVYGCSSRPVIVVSPTSTPKAVGSEDGKLQAVQIAKDRTKDNLTAQFKYFYQVLDGFGYYTDIYATWSVEFSEQTYYTVVLTPHIGVTKPDTTPTFIEIMGFVKEDCPEGIATFLVNIETKTVRPDNVCASFYVR